MTETFAHTSRPGLRRPGPARREPVDRRSAVLAAALAAVGAAAVGLLVSVVPVLAVWAADDRSGAAAADAVRAAAALWLLAHGAWLELPGARLGLTPLGLTLLPLYLTWRAGRYTARATGAATPGAAVAVTVAVAVCYATIAGLAAGWISDETVRPDPRVAALCGLLVAAVGAGVGALREVGPAPSWPDRVLHGVRTCLLGGLTAVAVLVGAGALLAAAALGFSGGQAVDLARTSAPGAVGGVGLLLLGLVLVPNAAIWGASWLAGPGFAVGTGTGVGPFGVELGPVPGLPLLAALPGAAPPLLLALLALAVPVAAGAVAGCVVHRRLADADWRRSLLQAGAAGPVAGAALALLAVAAGGSAGGERLAVVGPSPWRVGVAVCVEVAVGAVAAVFLLRRRRRVRPPDLLMS